MTAQSCSHSRFFVNTQYSQIELSAGKGLLETASQMQDPPRLAHGHFVRASTFQAWVGGHGRRFQINSVGGHRT